MVLEATMIIVDNSEWARNGDFYPTRWEAQEEAANMIAQTKCDSNPENSVGLMMMAGKQVEVLVTPLQDPGRVLASFHGVKLSGKIQLSTALQIGQLALKHRLNKNQKQRLVVFVASPVWEDEQTLVALGKKLKKNGVALDIINLESEDNDQNSKLQKLVETVDSSDNSHYIQVQPGIQLLSDILLSTPVLMGGEGGAGMGAGAGGDFGMGGGSMDPELEMAIRISLEEEKERARKREEEEKKKGQEAGGEKIVEEKPAQQPGAGEKIQEEVPKHVDEMDEEELMRRAQELSLQENPMKPEEDKKKQEDATIQDPNFVNELLSSIGVDQNNEEIKKALEELNKKDDKDNKGNQGNK